MKKVFDGKISKDEYDKLVAKGYLEEICTLTSSEYRSFQKYDGKEIAIENFDGSKLKVKVSIGRDSKQLSRGAVEVDYRIHVIK
jgi:hypothetical protein